MSRTELTQTRMSIFIISLKGTYILCTILFRIRSSGYTDELAWAAGWLYRATNEQDYLTKALEFASTSEIGWGFSWDEKVTGYQVQTIAGLKPLFKFPQTRRK